MTELLDVRGLGKTFLRRRGLHTERVAALTDVSFSVAQGEVLALVGESGSGKTTAARIIARLLAPSAGRLLYRDRDVLAEEPRAASLAYRSKVQLVFQDPFASLNPVHTVGYHLERPLRRHRKAEGREALDGRIAALLEAVGLRPAADFARKHPHQLSGGQRQRVAVARALAVDPELIVADEPVSMLDLSVRIDVLNLLRGLKERRGLSYLYITHDLGSARYFADRAVVLYAGRVVESAPIDQLLDQPAHPYTQLLCAAAPGARLPAAPLLAAPPEGCAFAGRCQSATERCRREAPALLPLASGRLVRCHLYDGRP
jgi:peptide/nickel transport system ATP-binding protein